jgi:anti-anti-sigma factor
MTDEKGLSIRTGQENGSCVIDIGGHADETQVHHLESALRQAQEADGAILDLGELSYMASWGFGLLVSNVQKMQEQSKPIRVVPPREGRIRKLFDILQLDRILPYAATREEALETVRSLREKSHAD